MAGRRRHNNEGTVTKRADGRWEARVTLEDGSRKSLYGKTRQEATRKLTEALRDIDKGLPIVGEKQTVAQYLASWLDAVAPTVGPTTDLKYREQLRLHVVPVVGKIALSKLSAQQVQAIYAAALRKGLSTTTVNRLHKILHHALDDAMRLGLVQRNVTDMVDAPRVAEHEINPLSPEQARTFLATIAGDRLEALGMLALSTGMRQGELLALRWQHVDLDRGVLQVRAALKMIFGTLVLQETKTKRSRRRIALTPSACEALRRHRARQLEERLALGPAWQDNDLVFPNTIGKPLDPRGLQTRWFKRQLRKGNLPTIRFHDLRHTAATLLLLEGVHPKVVSEMLGHASIAITLDLYSHVLPDMQHEATKAMERLLGGELSSKLSSNGP